MATYIPLSPLPFQFQDSVTSVNLSGGSLEFYLAGTSTPTNLFSDNSGTVVGTSILLNSGGFPESGGNVITLFRDISVNYKLVLKNAAGTIISTSDNISAPEFVYLQTAAEATAGVTPSDVSYEPGDVRRYGAVGNDTTDDTQAFSNALLANQRVLVPWTSGKYKITAELALRAGHEVLGVGALPIIRFDGSMASANLFQAASVNEIRMRNLALEGDQTASASGTSNGSAIRLETVNRAWIQDCEISGFPQGGVSLNDCTDVWVNGNRIDDIAAADVSTTGVAGINVEDVSDSVYIESNNITNIGLADGYGIGIRLIEQTAPSGAPTRCVVQHNVVEEIQTHGIVWYAGTTATDAIAGSICNNIVRRTGVATTGAPNQLGNGIYLLSVDSVVIDGNYVDEPNVATGASSISRAGIAAAAESGAFIDNVIIANNVVKDAGTDGIRLQHGRGCSIIGNTIDTWAAINAAGIGIYLSAATGSDGNQSVGITGNSWRGETVEEAFQHGASGIAATSSDCYVEVFACPYRTSPSDTVFYRNYGTGCRVVAKGTSVAPTGGTAAVNDVVKNWSSANGEPVEFHCVSAGSPGTWANVGQIGYRTNAGTPSAVLTPNFIGERVFDTTNEDWYTATGAANTDWKQDSA